MVSPARQAEANRKHQEGMERLFKVCPNPVCATCGIAIPTPTKFQRDQYWRRGRMYCSPNCSHQAKCVSSHRDSVKKFLSKFPDGCHCDWCGEEITDPTASQRATYRKTKRIYCSVECGKKKKASASTQYRKRLAKSEWLDLQARQAKSRQDKWTGQHDWQKLIHHISGLEMEYVVKCENNVAILDLADPQQKIGIEIDERHHNYPNHKRHDQQRDEELRKLGWKIYRFSDEDDFETVLTQIRSIVLK